MQYERKKNNFWVKEYSVSKVFEKDKNYNRTLKYLKNQKLLDFKKIKVLLKSFVNKKYPICYILIYKKKIVGFVGTIFSSKKFGGRVYLNCNIHSWLVDKEHRFISSMLFKKIMKNKYIITVLSALPSLRKTFLKLGFGEYIMKYKLVLIKKILLSYNERNFELVTDVKYLKKVLDYKSKMLLKYYSENKYKIFIFKNKKNKDYCFIIGYINYKKKFFKTFNLIYCNNKNFLRNYIKDFYNLLEKVYNISLCGEYYLKNSDSIFKGLTNIKMTSSKNIFIKNVPKKFKFDNLYSEVEY